MAEAVVSSLVDSILINMASMVGQEFGLVQALETDLKALRSAYSRIQAVLNDAEMKQTWSESLRDWLRKLRVASFEVENVLDEVSTEAMMRKVDVERGFKNRVSAFLTKRNPVKFRVRMTRKVKRLRERLDAIASEKSKFGLKEGGVDGEKRCRLTSSLVKDSDIVGRDEEKETMINEICNMGYESRESVSVYAIWGMGGIGKTTLAQLVYNSEIVTRYFELKTWVSVSDDFGILGLTRAILESIEGGSCSLSQLDPLQKRLQGSLRGKRFLLVLDDVWNEECWKWELLRQVLSCGEKGSVVLVTTRSEYIARMMSKDPESVHCVGCLSEDDSWCLFRRLAFVIGTTEERMTELEPIGKAIVKKCKGLPLALKALGSLMWSKSSVGEWKLVLESETWDLQGDGRSILPALKLSYDNLLPHFKQCFVYCCLIPKDYKIGKDLLIQLWMANGFVPSRGEADLYVLGEEIFNRLVWGAFFQDVEEDCSGELTCKMHDLMHDLAQSMMKYECLSIKPGQQMKFPKEVLHLWLSRGLPTNQDLSNVRSLRSVFCLDASYIDTVPSQICNQRYLRALCLSGISSKTLPESICNLKHLRYLNMSCSEIEFLPESVIYLQNLQVLNLDYCVNIGKLPKHMSYMSSLQFLCIKHCRGISRMPAGMRKLAGLRKLERFIVGQEHGDGIRELGQLNQLGGSLQIEGLSNIKESVEATSANLKSKQNLISLSLHWHAKDDKDRGNIRLENKLDEEALEFLEPHLNLKKMEIYSNWGLKFPGWMINLVNLTEVRLEKCERWRSLPQFGKLPLLRFLVLRNMGSLNSFHDDDCHNTTMSSGKNIFSCLRELIIENCPRLVGLPANLPKLEILEMKNTNEIAVGLVGKLSTLTSLEIGICHELKVFPDKMFANVTALRRLSLSRCCNLESFPREHINFKSLEDLKFYGFNSLTTIPPNWFQSTPNLQTLEIGSCERLESLPEGLQHLTSLKAFGIRGFPKMKSLPEGILNLLSLSSLYISGCSNLTYLPDGLQNLLSLSSFHIGGCPSLLCLPEGLQNLNALRYLDVIDCENVKRRCVKHIGEDWPKIAHVPYIQIDDLVIQSLLFL